MARGYTASLCSFLGAAAFAVLISCSVATAGEGPADAVAPPLDILDGSRFSGELVPQGSSTGPADDFIFEDGKFHSRACLEWGFEPGPYWIRAEDGRLHFLARLSSEENGVMTYTGTVSGSNIDARVEWVKPRWYWTIERAFTFQGSTGSRNAVGGR